MYVNILVGTDKWHSLIVKLHKECCDINTATMSDT